MAIIPPSRAVTVGTRQFRIWDTATGWEIRETSLSERISCAAVSPDGRFLATGGQSVILWDAQNGNRLMQIGHDIDPPPDRCRMLLDGSCITTIRLVPG